MKLSKSHLFFILVLSLLFSTLGFHIIENMENMNDVKGLKKEDIKDGDEDLYILKSQVVPPVCPKCPDNASCPKAKDPPPCPPCGRCPEAAFECKKVPNYSVTNIAGQLPVPMLNSFADFN